MDTHGQTGHTDGDNTFQTNNVMRHGLLFPHIYQVIFKCNSQAPGPKVREFPSRSVNLTILVYTYLESVSRSDGCLQALNLSGV